MARLQVPLIAPQEHINRDKDKAEQSVLELRKIGWFGNTVLDKLLVEVKK